MSADLLTFPADSSDDLAIEPDDVAVEIEAEVEPELGLDIEPDVPDPPAASVALVSTALVEILPADFPLPILAKFVPAQALRVDADQAAAYALSIKVEGADGLQRADVALTLLRTSLKTIEAHFEEPTRIANDLHKRLTGIRSEWQASGKAAVESVGRRVYAEQRRLEDLAAAERRKAQEEADRQAREEARREAAAAQKAQAPAPVVEELKRQAETATAPPVAPPVSTPSPLKGSSSVTTWKARIAGTPGSDEPNPKMADLTPSQRSEVLKLVRAVIDGAAPLTVFELNWSLLNARAKAEKSTLSLPGVQGYEDGSIRAKGQRAR